MADDSTKSTYNMAEANAALADSFGKLSFEFNNNIKGKRSWIMANRLFVGSPFWKLSNKIKGINDGFVILHNTQKDAIKRQKELTKATDDFIKVSAKIPKTGLFKRDGSALTSDAAKIEAAKIMEGEEFQNRLALNQRLKAKGASLGGMSAMDATKKQFDEMIKLQQDQLDAQLELTIKEEKYREMGFMGKLARKWDTLKGVIKALPGFLWKGTVLFGKVLWGLMWFVIFAPLVMKVVRWAYKYIQNLTPEQRKVWANARDRIMSILGNVKDLIVAIWEGRWMDAIKIYFSGIIVPIAEGIWALLKVTKRFAERQLVKLYHYIVSGQLADAIGTAIDEYMGSKGKGIRKALNVVDTVAMTVNPWYALARFATGTHWTQKALSGEGMGSFQTFASGGTMVNSGMALVGEGGPELVSLPQGARVHSNFASRGMGGSVVNVNVTGRVGASDAEIRDIANKVAKEINTHMNRTSSSTVRFA